MTGHYDTLEECVHTVKEKGCEAGKRDTRQFHFELPALEPDMSAEAQGAGIANRTSKAVSFKDNREGNTRLHVEDFDDSEPTIEMCPSWLGQVFQV